LLQLKGGKPPLLGEDLNKQVISNIKEVHEKRGLSLNVSGEAIVNKLKKGLYGKWWAH